MNDNAGRYYSLHVTDEENRTQSRSVLLRSAEVFSLVDPVDLTLQSPGKLLLTTCVILPWLLGWLPLAIGGTGSRPWRVWKRGRVVSGDHLHSLGGVVCSLGGTLELRVAHPGSFSSDPGGLLFQQEKS